LNVKDDIEDLCYKERVIPYNDKTFIAHDYLCSELEHRAWEKWGGPEGLKAARQRYVFSLDRLKLSNPYISFCCHFSERPFRLLGLVL